MKIVTFNVNGIRSILGLHGGSLSAFLESLGADIVCLQETKIARSELHEGICVCQGWESFFSFCRTRKQYSGVATFVRCPVVHTIAAEEGVCGTLNAELEERWRSSARASSSPGLVGHLEQAGLPLTTPCRVAAFDSPGVHLGRPFPVARR